MFPRKNNKFIKLLINIEIKCIFVLAATVNAKSHSKKRRLEEIETDEERWRRDPLDLDGIVPLAPGQIGGDELLGGNGTKENS